MRSIIGIILTLSIGLWVMPLGSFIDVSMEDVLCNGRRAICMCSEMSEDMSPAVGVVKPVYQKIASKSGGSSPKFLVSKYFLTFASPWCIFSFENPILTTQSYAAGIEHVPRILA